MALLIPTPILTTTSPDKSSKIYKDKIKEMQNAADDSQFMADIAEITEDFKNIDKQDIQDISDYEL